MVFGALALIFAAWGAYGVANLNFGTGTYAAKVNGHTIPYEEVKAPWQRQVNQWQQRFGGDIPAGERSLLQDQLLESVVRNTLIVDRAHDLGYRVPQEQLAAAVRAEPAFQLDGKYNADVAKSRLLAAGITIEQYTSELESDLERRQLLDGIQLSQFVTPAELERMRALNDQERQIRYAVLPFDKFAATVTTSDAAIQAYYDAHKAQYMIPESVHLQYAQLTLAQVAAQINVSDADLQDYYAKNKNRYISTEQRHAHHILVAVNDKVDAAAALKKAQDLEAKLKAGANFKALAEAGLRRFRIRRPGGRSGHGRARQPRRPVRRCAVRNEAGRDQRPVRTKFGYHIIRLDDIAPAKGKTFEEARADVLTQLKHDRAADRFGDLQEQIQQKVDQSGETLETLAKEFGLTLGEIPDYLKGAGGGDLGPAKEVQDVVFGDAVLGEHKIGGPVLVGEDRLVLVRDLSHTPAAPKPLAAVRDQIVAALRKEAGSQAALAAAQSAVRSLQAGKDFAAVVQGLGVAAMRPASWVARTLPCRRRSARPPSRRPSPPPRRAPMRPLRSPTAAPWCWP